MHRTFLLLLLLALAAACQRTPLPETPAATRNVPPPPPPAQTAAVPELPPESLPAAGPAMARGLGMGADRGLAMGADHGALPPGHPPVDARPVVVGAFPPADKTIADLRAQRATLVGQAVAVRGRVIKVNRQILGKNWLHLRDGSDPNENAELVVTTQGDAQRGDLVRVRGTVAIDRDVGAGFRYDVLLEDAMVVLEAAAVEPAAEVTPK